MQQAYFREDEREHVLQMVADMLKTLRDQVSLADVNRVHALLKGAVAEGRYCRDKYGINPVERSLHTAQLLCQLIAPDRNLVIATLVYNLVRLQLLPLEQVSQQFGADTAKLVRGLVTVSQLYRKQAAVADDNFHKLLISLADDIRVIIIMAVDRLGLMRMINHHPDDKFVMDVASESRYLYAPLAHRLGLYAIKQELEDLSLKYLNRKMYSQIASMLNEKKRERDEYMHNFIESLRAPLEESGLRFAIKGRPKSINSIYNKMRKKDVDLKGMYDLFAIRIIIDTPLKYEKRDCWMAYSVVTDLYTPNTARLKDWIGIPKSNGYESLHITVQGPGQRWVEVQIRTQRMDEIAERGLAAHWRYKGVKSDGDADRWMNNVREVLEAGSEGQMSLIRDMNIDLYHDEVFVFTPKGDLFKLPKGASVLDFAFSIHSNVGCHCTGARVDGKNQKMGYKLCSGDTVEILTSSTQMPRQDWLNLVVTSKARNKIRQAVNEARQKKVEMARELVLRRFRNRKLELEDRAFTRVTKKMGYKTLTDFYVDIHDGIIDVAAVIDQYADQLARGTESAAPAHESAENFVLQTRADEREGQPADVLVIGNNVWGINYRLSRCCNPIYGDDILGFIGSDGAIKIHRTDCGNLHHLRQRYPYRIIPSRWSGKLGSQFAATLKVVGQDDIGIVTNITSLINKEDGTVLRNISINSSGGLFEGYLVVGVPSLQSLDDLMRKIKNLKGVKDVVRA